jgi:hypothetical protein
MYETDVHGERAQLGMEHNSHKFIVVSLPKSTCIDRPNHGTYFLLIGWQLTTEITQLH